MSTSINNLPVPPMDTMSESSQFVQSADPNAQYNPSVEFPPKDNGVSLDSDTVQELVRGLQEANSSGATSIPVRDIPQNIQQDAQVNPNYIPPNNNQRVRFEEEEDENEYDGITEKNTANNRKTDSFNYIYDELQTPILLGILFFIFQLPVVRLLLYKYLPAMHIESGTQLNLFGISFCSVIFGFGYMLICKLMSYLSSF